MVVALTRNSVTTSFNALPGTLKKSTAGDDAVDGFIDYTSPVLRNGIEKRGECVVEVGDITAITKTLAQLIALRSPVGKGDYHVSLDGVAHADEALVDVTMLGEGAQLVKVAWKGTYVTA